MATKARKDMIAKFAYANVAGHFAKFHNRAKYPNFDFSNFVPLCDLLADQWAWVHITNPKAEDFELMRQYVNEISEQLLKHADYEPRWL